MKSFIKLLFTAVMSLSFLAMSGCGYFKFYSEKLGDSSSGNFYDIDEKEIETPLEDFEYDIYSGKVRIKKYKGESEAVAVPKEIDGTEVAIIAPHAFAEKSKLKTLYLPETITQIGDWAFSNCVSLTKISNLNSLENIGEYAFSECRSLNEISFLGPFTEIRRFTFYNCYSLQLVKFSSSVTKIGASAFEKCSYLRDFPTANGLEVIGTRAFLGCSRMGDFPTRSRFTSIEDRAFEGCTSLYQPVFSSTLTKVGNYAFADCTGIDFAAFPGQTSIANTAFKGCDKEMGVFGPPGSSVEAFARSQGFNFVDISRLP